MKRYSSNAATLNRRKKRKEHAKTLGHNQIAHATRVLKNEIIWDFLLKTGATLCYRCNKPLTKQNWTIDHIIPWRNSQNPKLRFFDISNIAYSHLSCNSTANKHNYAGYANGCRCTICTEAHRLRLQTIRKRKKI